jgi:hypothetical protein
MFTSFGIRAQVLVPASSISIVPHTGNNSFDHEQPDDNRLWVQAGDLESKAKIHRPLPKQKKRLIETTTLVGPCLRIRVINALLIVGGSQNLIRVIELPDDEEPKVYELVPAAD